ncbi:MAG TPA: hypothetical protein PLZ27_04105 [Bacillota bacterium]|nr:hypothetical protein [Bacillota bacterium]
MRSRDAGGVAPKPPLLSLGKKVAKNHKDGDAQRHRGNVLY